jgi:phosphopantothenate---cysteine ligase (CTP)
MEKKVIITAGGTSEQIDGVRRITNMATGKLGSQICDELLRQNGSGIGKIYYVCPPQAVQPNESDKIKIVHTGGTLDVKEKLETIMRSEKIDYFIHSMAVSDFTTDYVSNAKMLADDIVRAIEEVMSWQESIAINGLKKVVEETIKNPPSRIDASSKISSHEDNLQIGLKPTPKVISFIKEWQPETFLVGFKLLNGAGEKQLFTAAYDLLEKNKCDLVVANDLTTIKEGKHTAMIIEPDGTRHRFSGKSSIAENLVRMLRI